MAIRKMTFTIPEDLAALREREERLIRACEVANGDADVLAIEQEWDALRDNQVEEPWDSAPTR
jgi:hypothetical protein